MIIATTLAVVAFQISNETERSLRKALQVQLVEHLDSIVNSIDLIFQQSISQVESLATRPEVVAATILLIDDIEQPDLLLASPGQRVIRNLLTPLRDARLFRDFYIVAPGNKTLATFEDARVGNFNPLTRQPMVLARAWSGDTTISLPQEPHWGGAQAGASSRALFSVSPIRNTAGQTQALLLLEMDTDATLYRAIGHYDNAHLAESYLFDHSTTARPASVDSG